MIPVHRIIAPLLCGLLLALAGRDVFSPVRADDTGQLPLTWDRSLETERRFSDLLADFNAEEWESVVTGLESLRTVDAQRLVEIQPGRFLSGRLAARVISGRLPAQGLGVLQARLGADAVLLQQAGRPERPEPWHRLLQEYFGVSQTEAVVTELAQDAWLRGDLDSARRYWAWLSDGSVISAPAPWGLHAPRSELGAAEVDARIILCDLFDRRPRTARQRWRRFQQLYPDAEGRLGDVVGPWTELLKRLIDESEAWTDPAQRPGAYPVVELVRRRWVEPGDRDLQGSLKANISNSRDRKGRQAWPTIVDGVVIIPRTDRVRVLDVATGQPAWPTGLPGDDGTLWVEPHQGFDAEEVGFAAGAVSEDQRLWVGRLGPGWLQPGDEQSTRDSTLVAMDLDAEGRVAWIRRARDIFTEDRWCFSGVPFLSSERVIVTMRGTGRGLQLALVCLDADTGSVLWTCRPGAIVAKQQIRPVPGLERLSAGWGAVYWNLDGRMLLAVDASTGTLRWMTVLSSARASRDVLDAVARGQQTSQFDAGRLYVVDERSRVHAVDPETGALFWSTHVDDRLAEVVGICDDVVVVAGSKLWGVDALTGQVQWQQGFDDPEAWLAGRSVLLGRTILAPTRDELWSVDAWSGAFRQRRPLSPHLGPVLGHLWFTGSSLVSSSHSGLHCFEVDVRRVPPVAAVGDAVD